jgi:hypothetical protein
MGKYGLPMVCGSRHQPAIATNEAFRVCGRQSITLSGESEMTWNEFVKAMADNGISADRVEAGKSGPVITWCEFYNGLRKITVRYMGTGMSLEKILDDSIRVKSTLIERLGE